MQPIALTEEHRSKLLEMCKALFPNYFDWRYGKHWASYELFFVNNNQSFQIHWFEFCMTWLMYTLSYEFSKSDTVKAKPIHIELCELNKGDYFKIHPIDYLYGEFKKLK